MTTTPTGSPRPALSPTLYATTPTSGTKFLRTFLPWQIWRFIRINLKMMHLIQLSHKTHVPVDTGPKKFARGA